MDMLVLLEVGDLGCRGRQVRAAQEEVSARWPMFHSRSRLVADRGHTREHQTLHSDASLLVQVGAASDNTRASFAVAIAALSLNTAASAQLRRVTAGGVWAALSAGAMPAMAPVTSPMRGATRVRVGLMVAVQWRWCEMAAMA